MKNRTLKICRVVVSVTIMAMVTLLWVEYSALLLNALGWIERIQIIPVSIGFSFGILVFWWLFTSLFGRIYCSSICPLGTLQDIVARVGRSSRQGSRRDYHYSPPLTTLRYTSLAIVIACLIGGLTLLPTVVDPYSIYTRSVVDLLKPVWGCINNLLAKAGTATGLWDVTYVHVFTASAFGVILSIVSITAITIPAWFYGRTFCNTICPVGTTLGLISKQSLWHIDIDTDLCTNCRRCEHACKASCINMDDHTVDGSRCVNCFNCLTACRDNAIFYRPTRKQLSIPMLQRTDAKAAPPAAQGQAAPMAECSTDNTTNTTDQPTDR